MILILLILIFYTGASNFNCNENMIIKVPNFEVTVFFLKELYRIDLNAVRSLKCADMEFVAIENNIFTEAVNLKKLDLSNNQLTNINLPYPRLDEVNLSSNNFSKFSKFSNGQKLEIGKLNLSHNNLTSDSGIFKENIDVSSELDVSNNLLTAVDLNKMFKKGTPKFSNVNISNNFISTVDSHLITLVSSSDYITLCPMLINVVCREKGLAMDTEMQKLMNKAGKLDLSCLSTSLPECGVVSVQFKNEKERDSISVLFEFPDLKKVFIDKSLRVKLSSPHFNIFITNIHNDNLIDNKFSVRIPLYKAVAQNEKIKIYFQEVKLEGFDDYLSPNIGHFIFRSNEHFDLYLKNYYIDNRLKKIGIVEPLNTDESDGFVEDITHNELSGIYYFWSIFGIVILFTALLLYFKIVERVAKRRNSINDFYEVNNLE